MNCLPKNDLFWEQESLELLKEVVEERIRYYNFRRKHLALGHKSPIQYLEDKSKLTLLDVIQSEH
ncbi:MAG: IS3 family transposase [Candidatus Helarchaeota archaeon]